MVRNLLDTAGDSRFDPRVREDTLEKEMAGHSTILAWEIPWKEKPGGLQSMGSQCQTWLSDWGYTHTHTHTQSMELKWPFILGEKIRCYHSSCQALFQKKEKGIPIQLPVPTCGISPQTKQFSDTSWNLSHTFSSDASYLELASGSTGWGLSPTRRSTLRTPVPRRLGLLAAHLTNRL